MRFRRTFLSRNDPRPFAVSAETYYSKTSPMHSFSFALNALKVTFSKLVFLNFMQIEGTKLVGKLIQSQPWKAEAGFQALFSLENVENHYLSNFLCTWYFQTSYIWSFVPGAAWKYKLNFERFDIPVIKRFVGSVSINSVFPLIQYDEKVSVAVKQTGKRH